MQTDALKDKVFWGVAAAVVLAIAGGVYYYLHARHAPLPQQAPPRVQPPASPAPTIQNPIPDAGTSGEATAQPPLNESDGPLRDTLTGVFGDEPIEKFLIPQNIVRRIVATIDNLPRKKVAVELRPIKSTPGTTLTSGQDNSVTLSGENSARYAPLMRFVQSMDAKQLTDVYFAFYPLFQEAYENLGYPGQYFNDRLVQVIDDLLAAPEVKGPIELIQPRVFYEFKDPQLEARSAGQKLLIRVGAENETLLKAKLREVRRLVAGRAKPRAVH